MKLGLGVVLVGQLVHDVLLVRSILHSGLCGVIDVLFSRCWSLLRYLEAFGRVITTACCESNPLVSHSCLKLSYHIFPALVE